MAPSLDLKPPYSGSCKVTGQLFSSSTDPICEACRKLQPPSQLCKYLSNLPCIAALQRPPENSWLASITYLVLKTPKHYPWPQEAARWPGACAPQLQNIAGQLALSNSDQRKYKALGKLLACSQKLLPLAPIPGRITWARSASSIQKP